MAKRNKKTTDLDYWLESAVTPVFVIDPERRLRSFNAGCQRLTGWQAAEVVGEVCHYGSVSEVAGAAALSASLCPPPEVFAGDEASVPAHFVHRDGHALARVLHFFPLRDEKDRLIGVMGIISALPPPPASAAVSTACVLHAELAALRIALRTRFGSSMLVAQSPEMRRVLGQVEIARQNAAPVLISGAPGAGREHLARVIHFGGAGRANWFVPIDCRRLGPDEINRVWNRILESYQAGPGARSPGAALPGTVFLADVEFMPRDLQERLVGGIFSEPGPLRLLASTSRSLSELSAAPDMRADFLAFISPQWIEIPPLSLRHEDLPLLAQHFVEELNRQGPKQLGGFDESVWPLLARYDWPGNLDELAAVVRESHLHAAETVIRPHDLPFRFRTGLAAQEMPPPAEAPLLLLDPLLTKVETRLITLALERSRNNKSKAAELLGINRARLLRRLDQLQLVARVSETPDVPAEIDPAPDADDAPPAP